MLSCYGNRLQLVMFGMKSEWNACYSGRCKVYDDWLSDTELMEEIYFKGFQSGFLNSIYAMEGVRDRGGALGLSLVKKLDKGAKDTTQSCK